MKKKPSNTLTTEQFIEKARIIHGNSFDYSKVQYINTNTPVTIICPVHGEFQQAPIVHLRGSKHPKTSNNTKYTTEQFIEKAKQRYGNKFDYSKVNYQGMRVSVTIICPIHGEFQQCPVSHFILKQGCPKCGLGTKSLSQFIEQSNRIHNNKYDYSKCVEYTEKKDLQCIICPVHGEFQQSVECHMYHGHGCQKCGSVVAVSKPENEIVELIKKHYNDEIQTSVKSIIKPHELDIYLPKLKLAIEFNGIYWHSTKDKNYHLMKTEKCELQGIKLIHIFENEFVLKRSIVESRILNATGVSQQIYGRKCDIVEISKIQKDEFLEINHIQGKDISSVCYGLKFENEIVSLMTFGRSRYNKNIEWELIRFANKCGISVIGGASRLLKHFEKKHNPKSLISYADRRWSNGNLYLNLEFKHTGNTSPNYWYFKSGQQNLQSRIQFQKHKLKKKLPIFNPDLSEMENMTLNGYRRIYDCGNMRFEKHYP